MMRMPKTSLGLAALAALALLSACDQGPPDGSVRVSNASVRLPAGKGQPGAAYFMLEAGSEGTRLTGISSPLVRRIELHETTMKGDVSRMQRKKDIEFPPSGEMMFEPGGKHAMLFGIDSSVKSGGKIPLTFSFNVAPPVTVDAEVRSLAEEGHAGH
jgi:periplasmic copper chaperone A